ncbi:hypothetical protein [Embleya sp. NPDC005971]|uniref:hypothetical protein n=1 Tax=Embleya sp. NPDC005971 TaxID=3156724 RepID=UPI0033C45679
MSTIIPDELDMTESRGMRARTIQRIDVLDKVKAVAFLPDGLHATTEIVASYYEVGTEAIKSLVKDNRRELESNDYRVLTGAERAAFVGSQKDLTLPPSRHIAVFTRRTILNVGQLLAESPVAKQVRTYLLNVEEEATPEQKATAIEKAAEAEAQLRAIEVLGRIDGNTSYARSLSRHIAARMLGQEPEVDPLDFTITADEYLTGKGMRESDLPSARTRMGKTVAALYRARYSKDPQKIRRPINGVHREVSVYTHRDIDLFDTAWSEIGRHYDVQGVLVGGAA